MTSYRPLLAVTTGDPAGIGPEIAAMTLAEEDIQQGCRPLVIGDACVMETAVRLCGLDLLVHAVDDPADGHYRPGTLDVLDLGLLTAADHAYAKVTARQEIGRAHV